MSSAPLQWLASQSERHNPQQLCFYVCHLDIQSRMAHCKWPAFKQCVACLLPFLQLQILSRDKSELAG